MIQHQLAFSRLSDFYITLWSYLNTFFDDTRWLNIHLNGETPTETFARLETTLQQLDTLDDLLLHEHVQRDFNEVRSIRDSYIQSAEWLNRADHMRQYAQQLGLRYAQLAAEAPTPE